MHPAVKSLLSSLTLGEPKNSLEHQRSADAVSQIARVYEIARNALEYRAEHLVRRAAIERILKRHMVFEQDPAKLTASLKQELQWARYLSYAELDLVDWQKIAAAIAEHLNINEVDRNWLIGLISAHIESLLNPNTDYHRFTYFTFHVLRQIVQIPEPDLDLLLLVAVDRAYASADDQQISLHLYQLIASQGASNPHLETYTEFKKAMGHPLLNPLLAVVRKHIGPTVLLRDMYFYDPKSFADTISAKDQFDAISTKVLAVQISQTRSRINTATFRSLVYIFLTKVLLVVGLEMPVEVAFRGHINYPILLINLVFPVAIMWAMTLNIRLASKREQDKLLARTWQIVSDFTARPLDNDIVTTLRPNVSEVWNTVFYALYGLLFLLVYWFIFKILSEIGFSILNISVFVFFLGIVSFFAMYIRQSSQGYRYPTRESNKTGFYDLITLPFVTLGSLVSRGVSRLNFLAFFFDFILEAPIKLLLKVLDGWAQFLSFKRDELG